MTDETVLTFDAHALALGWLSVFYAAAKDDGRPALDRTVCIERFDHGIRLSATDSYVLLHTWVPTVEGQWGEIPLLEEAPLERVVAIDAHSRGKGFLGFALRLAKAARKHELPEVEVEMTLDVVAETDEPAHLDGMEPRYVQLEIADAEKVWLQRFEGDYPMWHGILGRFCPKRTATVALNPEIIGRLAKMADLHATRGLLWHFGGDDRMARVEVLDTEQPVEGIVMPVRWDFDRDAPREDVVRSEAGTEGDD